MLTALLACAPATGWAAGFGILTMLAPSEASAQDREIEVGTELMATSDVTLHKAEISKGSRVMVTKVDRHGGRVDGISVALADGHVVKMTVAQVHSFFRVVE